MNRGIVAGVTAAVAWAVFVSSSAMAGQDDNAERMCQSKITEEYGVDKFRNIWTETLGNHKFMVHGQVKFDNHKYDFNCKVKNGYVKSYAYNGPHARHQHKDHDDNDNVGAAIAVGAGLAIMAAVAVSQANDDNDNNNRNKNSGLPVSLSVLEDECHDMLQYRIRDEHDYTARVTMKEATLRGHDLVGDAKVKYDRQHPQHANYTCHFDNRGRLMDSQYRLY